MGSRRRGKKVVALETSGLLNVFKPPGMTSHDVVDCLRRNLMPRKLGHGGTLDPVACGVLVCLVNRATRLSPRVSATKKTYRAVAVFGIRTNTGDVEGKIVERARADISRADVIAALEDFKGDVEQTPPMASAIKVNGQRLYKLERKGIEIERPVRTVHIYDLWLCRFMERAGHPSALLEITCSGGTYVRTLVEDIGRAMGVPATTAFLARTAVGPFKANDSVDIADVTLSAVDDYLMDGEDVLE